MVSHLVKVAQKLPAQGPLPNNENVQSKFIQSAVSDQKLPMTQLTLTPLVIHLFKLSDWLRGGHMMVVPLKG